jgi:predicted  nucleic acid-binding Zn-ribbon protein
MTATIKPFTCLRCGHRYKAEHAKGITVERSCPKCGSNSVRLVPERAVRGAPTEED